jgi:nucleotide-binding universal stress UspA family protein
MTTVKTAVSGRVEAKPRAPAPASIMVHVDWNAGSDARIRLAANLADKFGAVLIGVAGWVPGRERTALSHDEIEQPEKRLKWIGAELDRLGERFREVAGLTVLPVEWRASFNFPREVIAREARAADLVVIGSRPAADDVFHTFDPGEVLLAAGRPVLVTPQGHKTLTARRILIAWKDTREARRAVQCALPFLQQADHITLVEVAEHLLEAQAQAHLVDVEAYLGRHGIKVGANAVLNPHGPIAHQLTTVAADEGADLIVAGAYGHTRLGEWIFGGATRGLLRTSQLCCLFST